MRGLPPEALTAGLPYSLEHLLNRSKRIDWRSTCILLKNASAVWSSTEFVELGRKAARSPWVRPFRALTRLFYARRKPFYLRTERRWGPENFIVTCIWVTTHEIEPNHYRMEVRMSDGYDVCPEAFLLAKGFLAEWTGVLGYGPGVVEMTETSGGVNYDICVPPRRGFLSRFRALSALWGMGVGRELRDALEFMSARARELEQQVGERVIIEQELRQSEERFRALSDATSEGILIHDGGKILEVNEALVRMSGYGTSELAGLSSMFVLVPPEYRDLLAQRIREHREDRTEALGLRKDGSTFDAEVESREVIYRGRRARVVAIRDITERKGAVRALLESEERHRRLTENANDLIDEIDETGRLVYVSPRHREVTGHEPDELLGQSAFATLQGPDRELAERLFSEAIASGVIPPRQLYRFQHKDGRWLVFESSGNFFETDSGERRLVVVSRDVTEQRQAEEALRESEERYRRVTENANDMIDVLDGEGRFIHVSPRHREMTGHEPDELVGTLAFDMMRSPDEGEAKTLFRDLVATGRAPRQVFQIRHADGRWLWFESTGSLFTTASGEVRAVIVTRDVSEQRKAEEALRESEERYRRIAENANDMIDEVDGEGRFLYVSPSHERVTGHGPKDLLGTFAYDWMHPDERERTVNAYRSGMTLGTAGPGELRVHHRDGGWVWLESVMQTFETASGETRAVIVSRDITERKKADEEKRQLEAQVQQRQKLESLGVAAGGIAHDFNNLLTPVLGYADQALRQLPENAPGRASIEQIRKAALRSAELTDQLLTYAGGGSTRMDSLNVSDLVQEMRSLLETATSRKAVLHYQLDPGLPAIQADAAQVQQVIMNLITNASEALGDRQGFITVRTGVMKADRSYLSKAELGAHVPEGCYVYFEVGDTGSGMNQETRAKIFDPFFTTKFTGRGLGLASLLGILRTHGGALHLESAPGRGSIFRVLFPSSGAVPQEREAVEQPRAAWRGRGTALVVEDDADVQGVVKWMLESAGFSVLVAGNGKAGLDLFRDRGPEISLVLLDRTMPEMSGEEVLKTIRSIRPDTPVLMCSGYSERDLDAPLSNDRRTAFIQKPFERDDLIEKLQEVLEA
jgi:PAS domain S-box-containing protein